MLKRKAPAFLAAALLGPGISWGAGLIEAAKPARPASVPLALAANLRQAMTLSALQTGPLSLRQAVQGLSLSAELQEKINVVAARAYAEAAVPAAEPAALAAETVPEAPNGQAGAQTTMTADPGRAHRIAETVAASWVARDFLGSVELNRLQEMPWAQLESLLSAMWDAKEARRAAVTALPRKFLEGSVFDPAFAQAERNKPTTIAFDLDETFASMDENGRWTLRPGAEQALSELQALGFRLVVWTAQVRPLVEGLFLSHPRLIDRFDLVITGENYLSGVMAETSDPEFARSYLQADLAKVRAFYSIDNPKDLSLLRNADGRGYALLVENNRQLEAAAADAPFGAFPVLRISSFYGDQTDAQEVADLPQLILRRLYARPEGVQDVTVGLARTVQDIERLIPISVTRDRLSKLKKAVAAHGALKVFVYKDSWGGFFVSLDLSDPAWIERLPLSVSEKKAVQRIRRRHRDIQLLIREGGKTPDLIVDGRLTEIKGASKGLSAQLRKANKQLLEFGERHGLGGGDVALQLNSDAPVPEDMLRRINAWASSTPELRVERIGVYSNTDAVVFLRRPDGSFQ